MKFKRLDGRAVYKNVQKSRIHWDKKSRSKFQRKVKDFLKNYWYHDICYEEMVCAGTRLQLDFFNATKHIAVEVHGEQHGKFNPFFHNNDRNKFLDQVNRDMKKREWCEINDFELIEIFAEEEKLLDKQPEKFKKMLEEKYKLNLRKVI